MAPEEILLLPPELRELRSYCPDGQVKQRALAGPITLSAPTVCAQKEFATVSYSKTRWVYL